MTDQLRAEVRDHYARAALTVLEQPGCCSSDDPAGASGRATWSPTTTCRRPIGPSVGTSRAAPPGALSFGEYAAGLAEAGLTGVRLTPTHAVGDGLYGAIVAAVRPANGPGASSVEAAAAASAGLVAARALPPAGQVLLGARAIDGEASCGPGCCCG